MLHAAIEYFAAYGIGDTSMRGLAAALGTSHRMLHHYFGSREGLLSAVIAEVEAEQRLLLDRLLAVDDPDPRAQLKRFWHEVTDATLIYGPLFFELSGQAMQNQAHALSLRSSLISPWLAPLERLFVRFGYDQAFAATQARLSLATSRGLLFDLLLTGERAEIDALMDRFIDEVFGGERGREPGAGPGPKPGRRAADG